MIQLKNAVLAVLALGIAGVANAAMYVPPPATQQPTEYPHGFYLGAGLGGIAFTTDQAVQGSDVAGSVDASDTYGASQANGNIGLNGVLFGGYNWTFSNKLFLGGEIFGNFFNTGSSENGYGTADASVTFTEPGSTTPTTLTAGADVTQSSHLIYNNAYGIRALPGYRVSQDAVIYAIIGYTRVHATNTGSTNATADIDGTIVPIYSDNFDQTYDFNGYQVGLGSMINITEHVAVRGDLIYAGYSQQTLHSASFSDGTASDDLSITANPTSLEADVSLVYMFD